jgi:DNA-binding NarL/FixJ family response regulator
MDLRPMAGRAAPPKASPLSAREAEVLALVARGHSNQEIADALVLSVRTVQRHIENAYTRLGVHNRAGATLAAVELGLVAPGDTRPAVG